MRGWLTAPMTPPAYAWPASTTGPSVRSMARMTALTSSSSVVSGMGAAVTVIPACCRPVMTRLQLDPSAHAPRARTTVGVVGLMGNLSTWGRPSLHCAHSAHLWLAKMGCATHNNAYTTLRLANDD